MLQIDEHEKDNLNKDKWFRYIRVHFEMSSGSEKFLCMCRI